MLQEHVPPLLFLRQAGFSYRRKRCAVALRSEAGRGHRKRERERGDTRDEKPHARVLDDDEQRLDGGGGGGDGVTRC